LNENNAIFKKVKEQMGELNKDVEASQKSHPVSTITFFWKIFNLLFAFRMSLKLE